MGTGSPRIHVPRSEPRKVQQLFSRNTRPRGCTHADVHRLQRQSLPAMRSPLISRGGVSNINSWSCERQFFCPSICSRPVFRVQFPFPRLLDRTNPGALARLGLRGRLEVRSPRVFISFMSKDPRAFVSSNEDECRWNNTVFVAWGSPFPAFFRAHKPEPVFVTHVSDYN